MKKIANAGKKGYKKKTYNDQIHEGLLPLGAIKGNQTRHNWGV
jgi:hypothetical protein